MVKSSSFSDIELTLNLTQRTKTKVQTNQAASPEISNKVTLEKITAEMSRLLTALVLLPILIASVWIPRLELLFVFICVAAIMLALREFWVFAKRIGIEPDESVGTIFALGILAQFYFELGDLRGVDFLGAVLALMTIALLARATLLKQRLTKSLKQRLKKALLPEQVEPEEAKAARSFERMIGSTGVTMLGVCYVALLGGYLIDVRTEFDDALAAKLLTFYFLILMGSDSAAYYTGRAIGKHKLAPAISPGKTWEGAAGGMTASVACAVIAHFTFFKELPLSLGIGLAMMMNVLGVVGDLSESALKRGVGAKDAASILPGHGGLLDRLDSLLFNAPVIYYFAKIYFG